MRTIPLTKGKEAIIDDKWYQILANYKWSQLCGCVFERG